MTFSKALSLSLGELTEPVVTRYRLGLQVHRLYRNKNFQGETLERLTKEFATMAEYYTSLGNLEDSGVLRQHPAFPRRVYRLLGRKAVEVEEVACSVDPFCYLSHFSAMNYHGLTDRLPVKLYLSSPASQQWKEEALSRMKKDLKEDFADYRAREMPLMERFKMEKIGRTEIKRFNSKHWGAYKNVRGKMMRVSTIGRTFLDMVRTPELCGGIRHVLESYQEHAGRYVKLIVDEVELHGAPIDKVRVGYILDEVMKIPDERIERWVSYAQRGGSRKLDASAEFMPEYSEKWSLSLNLD